MAKFDYSIIADFKKDVVHYGRAGMKRGYHLYGDRDYDPIGEKARGPVGTMGSGVGNGFKSVGQGAGQGFKSVGQGIGQGFKTAANGGGVGNGFKTFGRGVATGVGTFGSGISNGVNTMGQGFRNGFNSAQTVTVGRFAGQSYPGYASSSSVLNYMEYKNPGKWVDNENVKYLKDTMQAGLHDDNTVQGKYPSKFEWNPSGHWWDAQTFDVSYYYTPQDIMDSLHAGEGDNGKYVPFARIKSPNPNAFPDYDLYAGSDGVYKPDMFNGRITGYKKIAENLDDMAKKTEEFKAKKQADRDAKIAAKEKAKADKIAAKEAARAAKLARRQR